MAVSEDRCSEGVLVRFQKADRDRGPQLSVVALLAFVVPGCSSPEPQPPASEPMGLIGTASTETAPGATGEVVPVASGTRSSVTDDSPVIHWRGHDTGYQHTTIVQ